MRRDRRSVKEQVLSGLILSGELVGGIVVIVATLVGTRWIFPDGHLAPFYSSFKGWILVVAVTPVIYFTAERWAEFIPGFFLHGVPHTRIPVECGGRRLNE
jgi:hypothetical protein